MAAMLDLVDQDPKGSIRSLKVNAKENMKVLKEAVELRKKSLSSPLLDHHLLSALTIVLFSSAAASAVFLLPRCPGVPAARLCPLKKSAHPSQGMSLNSRPLRGWALDIPMEAG
jgi:hypothetical protein